jgi:hypothetical protein
MAMAKRWVVTATARLTRRLEKRLAARSGESIPRAPIVLES